jgi:hypothetical protein
MDEHTPLARNWVHVLASRIGVRLAGTEADRLAADFIEAELGRLLPEVRRHEFHFLGWEPGSEGLLTLDGEALPTRLGIGTPPTPPGTLYPARDIARAAGLRYVYTGNDRGAGGQDTICPACGLAVITREGFSVGKNLLGKGGACPCRHKIPGVWGNCSGSQNPEARI